MKYRDKIPPFQKAPEFRTAKQQRSGFLCDSERNCVKTQDNFRKNAVFLKLSALDQNRTDDLILTMDMLCQLSYKGIRVNLPKFWATLPRIYHSLEKIPKKSSFGQVPNQKKLHGRSFLFAENQPGKKPADYPVQHKNAETHDHGNLYVPDGQKQREYHQ